MTPEQIEQERAAFEAWYRRWAEEEPSPLVDIEGELQYKSTADHQLFSAWCGRAQQGGWISVEDRLPETETTVLICTKRGDIFSSWASNEGVFWFYGEEEDNRVTHWQPLPQPPKGEHEC